MFGSKPEHKKSGVKPEGLKHPSVVTEYERAMRAFMYKINLASNRVRRCFWAMRGWPAQTCFFGADDTATRSNTIDTLFDDYCSYRICKDAAPEFFGQKHMSVFETRPVKQAVKMCEVLQQNKCKAQVMPATGPKLWPLTFQEAGLGMSGLHCWPQGSAQVQASTARSSLSIYS